MERRAYLRSLAAVAGLAGAGGCLRSAGSEPTTTTDSPRFRIETVTMNLEVPWGAAFGPDGDLFLTERQGRVQRVAIETDQKEEIADLTDRVAPRGEGGLLGLAFHPDDADLAYTYQTYHGDDGLANRVVRHRVSDGFARESVVLDGIPGASVRDGGRIAFGPDGALYVATGDAGEGERAQNLDSLAGKVLRLTPDGEPHPDNPFASAVFTYGHRNPQGLAWRDGTLFGTDRGPDTHDELNVLRAGDNYGWPRTEASAGDESFADPVASYSPAVAPASATLYRGPIDDWRGDLFAGTLAGAHLQRVRIGDDDEVIERERLLDDRYGRLRTVFTGPDGHLYVTTSNRDGGDGGGGGDEESAAPQDDRVLCIHPA